MSNQIEHTTSALRQLGFRYDVDYRIIRDQVVVGRKEAIRALVESRELVLAAGLHVGLVADGDGRARAALVGVGEPGFFHVIVAPDGRPVAEQPMILAEDSGTPEDATENPTDASEEGDPTATPDPRPAASESGTPEPESAPRVAPGPERPRASAPEQTLSIATSKRLIAELTKGTVPPEASADPLVSILSPLAGSKGRAIIHLPSRALAARLAREATVVAERSGVEPGIAEAAGRLASELSATLAQSKAEAERPAEASTDRSEEEQGREPVMATKKKSGKKGAAKSTAKTTGKKKGAAKAEAQESSRRKITEDIVQQAIDMREDGATWTEVQEATGFNGAQLRPHIARLQGTDLKVPKTAKGIAKARKEGHAWYAIAAATGLTVAEVKEKAEEGGADVEGRVYKESEKDDKPAGKGKKTAGKKKGRKGKDDPSDED